MQRRVFVLYRGPRVFRIGDGVLRYSTWQAQTGRWSHQHQVERGCLRRLVNLRVIREGQGLDLFVPVPVMLLEIVSEALYQCTVEPFGLPIHLGVIGGSQVMPHPQEGAHRVEELSGELWPVIG